MSRKRKAVEHRAPVISLTGKSTGFRSRVSHMHPVRPGSGTEHGSGRVLQDCKQRVVFPEWEQEAVVVYTWERKYRISYYKSFHIRVFQFYCFVIKWSRNRLNGSSIAPLT